MCLIRTYEDDVDYPPPRRVIRADSYRRHRARSHSPPPPIVGIRQRISVSPVRSIRERLSRISVEERKPRRSSVQFADRVVALPKPPTPPPAAPTRTRVVREVEVVRSDDGSSSSSSTSSSSSSADTKSRSHGASTLRSYSSRDDKDYVVHRTKVERHRRRDWSPVRWHMDTSKVRERSRSRSRPAKGEWYYEEPRGSGIYRKESERVRRVW